jgi:hypothetical protein
VRLPRHAPPAVANIGEALNVVSIPDNPTEISAAWLSEVLTATGHLGRVEVLALAVSRFCEGVGVTADLYRLVPTYAPGVLGAPASLIAKVPSSLSEMRRVAASWGLYEREVLFYRELAPTISLRSPQCFFARFDPASRQFIVVMEDLSSAKACDQINGMSLSEARLAIANAATLHARWWDRPELKALETVIQPLGAPPYQMGARHAAAWPAMNSFLAARVSKEMLRVGERLASVLDDMGAQLAAGSRTLCHGDYRADNLMFRRRGDDLELVVVDWQIVMQARGAFDIGYMMSASVTTDLRREHEMALLGEYHRRLLEGGVEGYGFDQCLYDYRSALLMGFTYLVQAGAAADRRHPRTEAFFSSFARRVEAATADLGLADFVV